MIANTRNWPATGRKKGVHKILPYGKKRRGAAYHERAVLPGEMGFPGWHLECTAYEQQNTLGENFWTFMVAVWTLKFPHMNVEIAKLKLATGMLR